MCKTLLLTVTALLLVTVRGSAHHAFSAEYDEKNLITITGVVTNLKWTNPHVWLYIDGKDADGKAARWGFEMGAPGSLLNRGWKRADLKKGDHITVEGYRAKNNRNIANARTVVVPDGRTLFGGFKDTPGNPFK